MKQRLLQGISVLELTMSKVGSYAGMLLTSEGATVYKWDQNFDRYCDEGKTVLPTFEQVVHRKWDIILYDDSVIPHIQQQLTGCDAVLVKMHCDRCIPPNELELQAVAGWIDVTGCPQQDGLPIGGYPASFLCGAHVAFIALAGLFEKETGVQASIKVDCKPILVSALEGGAAKFTATGEVLTRVGNRHRTLSPMCIVSSADHFVFVGAPVDEQWALLASWADLNLDDRFKQAAVRKQFAADMEREIAAWSKQYEAQELVTMGQAFRLPFSKVQTTAQVRACEQLKARCYFEQRKPWQTAVWHKNHQPERKNRFEQLTILDLTAMWAGPYCTRLLADLGAQVIKIEAPHRPDGIRASQNASHPFFQELNRNKKAITLNLQADEDLSCFKQLMKMSDAVVENFSPRVMPNFGLTVEQLKMVNDELIFMSMSAFGQSGPYTNYVGYGPTIEAMSGLASFTTYNGTPWLPGFSVSDIAAGVHGAFSLMCAIIYKQHGSGFVRLDVAQYEVAVQLLGELVESEAKQYQRSATSYRKFLQVMAQKQAVRFYDNANWPLRALKAPSLGEHNEWLKREGYYV